MTPERDSSGKFPAYAWPGGYPVFYMVATCDVLCAACANGEHGSEASLEHDEKQWRLTAMDVYWEGDVMPCDHCGEGIESAYGPIEE